MASSRTSASPPVVVGSRSRVDAAPIEPRPVVLADAAQLHRAMLNLVSNAVKFSRVGGGVLLRSRPRTTAWSRSGSSTTDRDPGRGPAKARGAVLPRLERRRGADPGHRAGAADGAVDRDQPPRHLRTLLRRGAGDHRAPFDFRWQRSVSGLLTREQTAAPPALIPLPHRLAPARASVAHLDAGSGSRSHAARPGGCNPERKP